MNKLLTILSIIISSSAFAQKAKNMRLMYNETTAVKVVPLAGFFMDIKGKYYSTSISIPAHRSVILFELDQPPLALTVKSYNLSTNVNTSTIRTVITDDGIEKTVIFKYKFK
jgi:uncharacterized membrane protein